MSPTPTREAWSRRSRVSLGIAAGKVVALVGENGSGKTTLAKLLAGLYRLESGRITRNDVDIADIKPANVRNGISVIFRDFMKTS